MVNLTALARSVSFVLLVVAVARPAAAQIYSWRDTRGNLVLSDKAPQGTVIRSYQTPRPNAPFRTTRPAEAAFTDRFESLIRKHAATYDVSPDLVRAVVQVESGFNPRATSSDGAMGLMQLMPSTAIEMGVSNPYDPDQNIRGGVAYLRVLLNRYAGDVSRALAGYNAGPSRADRYGDRVPFSETRNYIAAVKRRTSDAVRTLMTAQSLTPGRPGAGATTGARAAAAAKRAAPAPPAPRAIYKTVEIIDGRPVAKYSDSRPAGGSYQVVPRR